MEGELLAELIGPCQTFSTSIEHHDQVTTEVSMDHPTNARERRERQRPTEQWHPERGRQPNPQRQARFTTERTASA